MRQVGQSITSIILRVLALAFIFAVGLNFANVVTRYLFGVVMLGADEVQGFILIVMTVLGAAVVTWHQSHITMNIIQDRFPAKVAALINCAAHLTLTVVAGLIAWQSWKVADRMFVMDRVSDAAQVPMWIVHGLVLAAFVLIALFSLYRAIDFMRPACAGVNVAVDVREEEARAP